MALIMGACVFLCVGGFGGGVDGVLVCAPCVWCSGKYMSAFDKGGEVSFDEEAAFCEHFTLHEIADSMPTPARRTVPFCPLF